MKKFILSFILVLFLGAAANQALAQCSICTRTAAQMGEKPARGLNAGILYLAAAPITIVGIIAFKWWRRNGDTA